MQGTVHLINQIERTARSQQLEGLFDVSPSCGARKEIEYSLPFEEKTWSIGLIVGPSGCGKTTIAKQMFGEFIEDEWHESRCIVDGFPESMTIQDITKILSSVGLSSPPCWLRPFGVLSNGEKFRATIARALASDRDTICIDEFTSVVDRTVAQIGSAAVEKYIRKTSKRLVAVSCHYDIIDWLNPDWIYDPSTRAFSWRLLRQRPTIELEIKRCDSRAWAIFKDHHYLSTSLIKSSRCFIGSIKSRAAAFVAVAAFPHAISPGWREHRTVCLPDFQGVGIGNAMANYVASLYAATNKPYRTTTTHPAMIAYRKRSSDWLMTNKPQVRPRGGSTSNRSIAKRIATDRNVASFRYVGEANRKDAAMFGVADWILQNGGANPTRTL